MRIFTTKVTRRRRGTVDGEHCDTRRRVRRDAISTQRSPAAELESRGGTTEGQMFPGGAPRSHPVSSSSSSCLAREGRGGGAGGGGDEEESVCLWRKEEQQKPASSSPPSPRRRRMWTVFVFLWRSVVRAASPGMWSGERGRGREAEGGGESGGGGTNAAQPAVISFHSPARSRHTSSLLPYPSLNTLRSSPAPPTLLTEHHPPPTPHPRGVSCSRFGVSHHHCPPFASHLRSGHRGTR